MGIVVKETHLLYLERKDSLSPKNYDLEDQKSPLALK